MPLLSAAASVRIECEGGLPARFLNHASAAGIPLWDIRQCDTSLWCRTAACHYRALRPVARSAGTRMRVRNKYGPVFLLRRHGFRWSLAASLLLFFALLQLLSSRIWVVQVEGNAAVDAAAILRAVEPYGVGIGLSFSDVDIPALRLQVLRDLPDIGWITVNQSGSIATVHVRERTAEDSPPSSTPSNIVASCDGVIVELHVTGGQAVVRVGDAVRRGDLLISGVTDSTVGAILKRAGGTVIARTTRTERIHVPLSESLPTVTRTVRRPSLRFFAWHIPLYTSGALEGTPTVTTADRPVYLNGIPLPLGLSVTTAQYTELRPVTRTAEEALALAEARLAETEITLKDSFTVESRSTDISVSDTAVTLTAHYSGVCPIGTEVSLV